MRSVKALRYSVILSLLALVLGVGQSAAAPQQQDIVLNITYPAEGSAISGAVEIQGTATHPNFASYGVLYAEGTQVSAGTDWRLDAPIAWDVRSMVVNGVLGTWDTTQVPNGQYVLALVVYEVGNDTPQVRFVNNLTVQNEETTPTPEPTPEPIATEAPPPPEAEGTAAAAPTIEQPPTATPRPTPTPGAQATPEETDSGLPRPEDIISVDNVKAAFSTGVQLAVMLYVFGGLYALIKAVVRYYLRQQHRKQQQQSGG